MYKVFEMQTLIEQIISSISILFIEKKLVNTKCLRVKRRQLRFNV